VFARRDLSLRERTLWRLLYETTARASELLCQQRRGPRPGQQTRVGAQ
jgi:hypothetical protein